MAKLLPELYSDLRSEEKTLELSQMAAATVSILFVLATVYGLSSFGDVLVYAFCLAFSVVFYFVFRARKKVKKMRAEFEEKLKKGGKR
jgi:Flp pilus assembly protein TadB